MKYARLIQIAHFLSQFRKISSIKRVGDMLLLIDFGKEHNIFFDLAKSGSAIYQDENFIATKHYQAPFDNALKKHFNSANITAVECLKNNRILKFSATQNGSYKSTSAHLYLEFTGRFTNAIITDSNDIIIEALRHIDNSSRKIRPNQPLTQLQAIEIYEKPVEPISDFTEFFKAEFAKINEQNLANLKEIKLAQIAKKIQNLNTNLNALENEENLLAQSNELSLQASVLLANLSNLKDHERKFSLKDFDANVINFSLETTPKLSANEFYSRSKRLRAKASGIGLERENLSEKINFYTRLESLVKNAISTSELEILLPRRKNQKFDKTDSENVKNFYINEYKISVGRNEKGNIELLKNARKDDIWLHLKDIASPHVIIKTNKLKAPPHIIEYAAKLCLNFADVGAGNYEIDYTKRNNVKISSGANVNYINFSTIILPKE